MLHRLYELLLQLWYFLTSPFRSHNCKQCHCLNYSDEAFFMWMSERRSQSTFTNEMLAADIVNRPLKCSHCQHPREMHGTLTKRLLTFDAMPDGGAVLAEYTRRQTLQRRERRFTDNQVLRERRPSVDINEELHGHGIPVKNGDVIVCHYDAFLNSTMEKFESSRDHDQPFRFTFGAAQVVPGWELGLKGVKPGAKRRITVPPELAYRGKEICGQRNVTIVFIIEVLSLESY